jgi:hypothetical protein
VLGCMRALVPRFLTLRMVSLPSRVDCRALPAPLPTRFQPYNTFPDVPRPGPHYPKKAEVEKDRLKNPHELVFKTYPKVPILASAVRSKKICSRPRFREFARALGPPDGGGVIKARVQGRHCPPARQRSRL